MKLSYSLMRDDFMINGMTLRSFYINARKAAGITITKLEYDSGVSRGTLRNLEIAPSYNGKRGNSVRAMLIALETLGYPLNIEV